MTASAPTERTDAIWPSTIVYPRIAALPVALVGAIYLAGYLLLDWLSFIEPYGRLNITPWNPGTGLSFVLVLLFGRRMLAFLFAAPLLSALLLQAHTELPVPVLVLSSALVGAGYCAAVLVLLRPSLRFDPALSSMRDLMLLGSVAVVSAAFVASSYVATMITAGLLPGSDFAAASLRYWVGDMIGIAVVAPFGLMALTRRRPLRLSGETLLQLLAIVAAQALVFGYVREQQFQLFYVLFLPIIWMAVRTGTEGVTIGVLVTQIGLILGVTIFPGKGHDVTAYQALMLVLATTGLVAGELVTEHRRTATQLRLHQDSLSHLARLGSMGEFAAAIAHELNQPLMAAGTYTRLVNNALIINGGDPAVAETASKAVAQVERAAEVVKRLRALVRLDRGSRVACGVDQIVRETLALCQPDLDRSHIRAEMRLADDLPPVTVDILQTEQALLNLIRNSIEAISDARRPHGTVSIEASADADFVEIAVRDDGPGFPPDFLEHQFRPFSSTKAEGLGFGLPLCKSIIEAHGGRLWLGQARYGAAVHVTLPVAKASDHG